MRVYLDTNIVGGFLRDFPARLSEFKAAELRGYRYYTSTDAISELALNPDFSSFERQIAFLRALVQPDRVYRQPRELASAELLRLTGTAILPPLIPAHQILKMLPFMAQVYTEDSFKALQQQQKNNAKDFLQFDKNAAAKVRELIGADAMPKTFAEYWAWVESSGELRATLFELAASNGFSLDTPSLDRMLAELQSFKSIRVQTLLVKLFPYTRLMQLKSPDRGDSVDIRHAVAAAYCDIFLTRDSGLREFFALGGDLWPYRVMAPEDFLARAADQTHA